MSVGETSPQYLALWVSKCEQYRLIRCPDNIQYILQGWQSPKFRNLSFHVNYWSVDSPLGSDICFDGLPATEKELLAERPRADADAPVGGGLPDRPDGALDGLRSSRVGGCVDVCPVPKGQRQNGRLISTIFVAAIHALPRHGPRSCNIRSGH